MGFAIRLLRYLVGAALAAGAACYFGVSLAAGDGPAGESLVELFSAAFSSAEPKVLAAGALLAIAGLLVARPFLSITLGVKRRGPYAEERNRPARAVGYLFGVALVFAGVSFLGVKLAVALAAADAPSDGPLAELVRTAFTSAGPVPPAISAAALLFGFAVARPFFSVAVSWKKKRRRRKMSLQQAIEELNSPDSDARLDAAEALTSAAKPETIPHLIQALGDATSRVRGQACEALTKMSGETFDFVDIGPAPMRAQSVAQWQAWWQQCRSEILSGIDPRDAGAGLVEVGAPSGAVSERATPVATPVAAPAAAPRTRTPRRKTSKTVPAQKPPAAAPAAAPATALTSEAELPPPDEEVPVDDIIQAVDKIVGGEAAAAKPPTRTSESGRNVKLGDMIRRKRMRQAREAAKSGRSKLRSVMPEKTEEERSGPPRLRPPRPKEEVPSPDDTVQDLLSDIEIDPSDLPPPDDDEELPPPT